MTLSPFHINRGSDFVRFFVGSLDEVALYDHVLTAADVTQHYAAFVNQSVPGRGPRHERGGGAGAVGPGRDLYAPIRSPGPRGTEEVPGSPPPAMRSHCHTGSTRRADPERWCPRPRGKPCRL
jgi:hypothetical protein